MNITILSELYPSDENFYSAMYVHARVKEYIKEGNTCTIYRLHKKITLEYEFDGVKVYQGDEKYLFDKTIKNGFDIILMHAPNPDEKYFILKNFKEAKVICWMHGLDSVSGAFTYPYSGNKLLHPIRFLWRLKEDIRKIISWKKFIKHFNPKIVVVSNWMKVEAEKFLKIELKKTILIPNPIDEDVFMYKRRSGNIKKLICLRSHNTSKYAIDIAIKSFANSKFKLDIYGKGNLLKYHKKLAREYNANVEFIEKFFPQNEMLKILWEYDFAVMPTRLDSQGVSVCEMNMTGLPVVTSDISGNKEYETRGTVRLPNENFKVEEIIDDINKNNSLEDMSRFTHEDMMQLASKKVVIKKELTLIKDVIGQ